MNQNVFFCFPACHWSCNAVDLLIIDPEKKLRLPNQTYNLLPVIHRSWGSEPLNWKLLMIFWVSCRILWWVWAKLKWIWEGYLQLLHNNIIKQSSYMYVLCPKNQMYSLSYCSECSALGPIICIFWLRRFRRNMKILTMQCHFLPALYDSWVSVDLWYIVWIFGSHFFKFIFIGKWVTDLLHVMVPV